MWWSICGGRVPLPPVVMVGSGILVVVVVVVAEGGKGCFYGEDM
jgi:hypothetical protein